MIQRIQSLYLLGAAIMGLIIFCFNLPILYQILSSIATSGLSVLSIFLFSKRSLQIKLCGLLLLTCATELTLFAFFYSERGENIAVLIPIVQAILIFLAFVP